MEDGIHPLNDVLSELGEEGHTSYFESKDSKEASNNPYINPTQIDTEDSSDKENVPGAVLGVMHRGGPPIPFPLEDLIHDESLASDRHILTEKLPQHQKLAAAQGSNPTNPDRNVHDHSSGFGQNGVLDFRENTGPHMASDLDYSEEEYFEVEESEEEGENFSRVESQAVENHTGTETQAETSAKTDPVNDEDRPLQGLGSRRKTFEELLEEQLKEEEQRVGCVHLQ